MGKDGERGSHAGAFAGAGPAHLESPDELPTLLPEPLRGQYLSRQTAILQDKIVEYAGLAGGRSDRVLACRF